jgi:hypothetical protein
MKQKKKPVEVSRLLRVWEEWPAEWLDPFRTPKQIEEARNRRRLENIPEKHRRDVRGGVKTS